MSHQFNYNNYTTEYQQHKQVESKVYLQEASFFVSLEIL